MLGLKFEIRLSDMTAADMLHVTCRACDYKYRVATHQLHARFPAYMPLVEIEKRMRCHRCGNRESFYWHVQRAVPPLDFVV